MFLIGVLLEARILKVKLAVKRLKLVQAQVRYIIIFSKVVSMVFLLPTTANGELLWAESQPRSQGLSHPTPKQGKKS